MQKYNRNVSNKTYHQHHPDPLVFLLGKGICLSSSEFSSEIWKAGISVRDTCRRTKRKVPLELHHSYTFHAWMRNCTYGCDSPLPDGILRTASLVHYGLIHILPTSEKKEKRP